MKGIRSVFRLALSRKSDVDRDVDEELAFHLSMREAKLRAQGLAPPDAARAATVRFGDLEDIRDACVRESAPVARGERLRLFVDELRGDVTFALRSFRRAKGFALAVILTLALGIGANAIIYALINAVVLRPIAGLQHTETLFELSDSFSFPALRDLRANVSIPLAASSERRMAVGYNGNTEQTLGAMVTGNFFSLLSLGSMLGRPLNDGDDVSGAAPVAVVSYSYWERSLGADASVIGRPIKINGGTFTIVGVAPRAFRGLHLNSAPALYIPVHSWSIIAPASSSGRTIETPTWGWLHIVGRLGEGMSIEQAHRVLEVGLRAAEPDLQRDKITERTTPRPAAAAALASDVRDAVVRFSTILTGVVVLVLLTACANIAGLLLSRAAYREREIAVRIALGAGRGRLVRQLLTESLVLSIAGGAAGIAVFLAARWGIQHVILPGGLSGSALNLSVDARLVAVLVAITLAVGLMVGVAPAIQSTRSSMMNSIKGGTAARGAHGNRLRGLLVTGQITVGLILLIGTGLFARALTRAFAIDTGYRTQGLIAMSVNPGLAQLDAAGAARYYADAAAAAAAMPGVTGVSWSNVAPLSSDEDQSRATIDGYQPKAGEKVTIEWSVAGPGLHDVMGIPMLAGRGFEETDNANAPPVLIVNETFAKRYFAGRNAVGAYVTMLGARSLVVGVAKDAKYHDLNEAPRAYAYVPSLQFKEEIGAPTMLVRTSTNASALLHSVVRTVHAVNPAVPVYDEATLSERLRALLAPQMAGAVLLAVFSGLALVVAAVGIYGTVTYAVNQRTREIGIRMALGASGASVVAVVLRRSVWHMALGIPLGVALAVTASRLATSFLYGVTGTDVMTLFTASVCMLGVGAVASYFPVRRAARVDPLRALRADG